MNKTIKRILWNWKYYKKITEKQYEELLPLAKEYDKKQEEENNITKGFPTFEERKTKQEFLITLKAFERHKVVFRCLVGTNCIDIHDVKCESLGFKITDDNYDWCCNNWEKVWKIINWNMRNIENKIKKDFEIMTKSGLKLGEEK